MGTFRFFNIGVSDETGPH